MRKQKGTWLLGVCKSCNCWKNILYWMKNSLSSIIRSNLYFFVFHNFFFTFHVYLLPYIHVTSIKALQRTSLFILVKSYLLMNLHVYIFIYCGNTKNWKRIQKIILKWLIHFSVNYILILDEIILTSLII